MPQDIDQPKRGLTRLQRLISLYAQSKSLPLAIPLVLVVLSVAVLFAAMELLARYRPWWGWAVVAGVCLWIVLVSWLQFKLIRRLGPRFYDSKEGEVALEREKVPVWAWIVYAVTLVGPAVLDAHQLAPLRLTLTISLVSFATFLIYGSKKHREIILGIVFGGLVLLAALSTALGVPPPFRGRHSWFLALMSYIVGAGLIAMVLVHLYNRFILRRIKEASPFGDHRKTSTDQRDQ